MATKTNEHWLGRPPKDAVEVERWTGTEWIPDDGQPGLSFSGKGPGFGNFGCPRAWSSPCNCGLNEDKTCPRRIAAARTCQRYGASNGENMIRSRKAKKL